MSEADCDFCDILRNVEFLTEEKIDRINTLIKSKTGVKIKRCQDCKRKTYLMMYGGNSKSLRSAIPSD